jgi:LPS-assembly protein
MALLGNPVTANAADTLCPASSHAPLPRVEGDPEDERTHLQADTAEVGSNQVTTFRGDVVIRRGVTQLKADEARYDYKQDTIHAQGNVRLMRNDLLITGEQADINMAEERGEFSGATYRTKDNKQGQAGNIRVLDKYRLELEQATYTTCDKADPDWVLRAGHILLNSENHQGSASNVVIKFKDVPFFYLPYMRFPIGEERLSGLLYPSLGNSDKHGTKVVLPFYWNIAPNYDATLTVNHMSRRGTMLENEFRYLGQANHGQFNLDYLANDKVYGEDRKRFRWQHIGDADLGWSTDVDYNYVADNDHLIDFGNSLNTSSTSYLDRRGSLIYHARQWQFAAAAQSYQVLSGSETYERLPQLTFNTRLRQTDNELNYDFDSEWVQFAHRDPGFVEGGRLDLSPAVSLPLRTSYGHLIPKLVWRYTEYDLDPATTTGDTRFSRSVPIFNLDGGLVFERDSQMFGTEMLQTLEPRLYYVYIPYRDQSQLPVFDSSDPGFSINDPFRLNRFDGTDRIGDANQITAALTTRLLDRNNGEELLMARLAQIFYFADRRVTLPGGTVETANRSDIIAELTTRPNSSWYLDSDITWSPQTQEFTGGNARISFTPSSDLTLNFNYRYQRDSLETNEAGFNWRLNPRWQFKGRRLYDLRNDRPLESSLGLRYDSCCWGLSLEGRERFINISEPDPYDKSILLVLELKGLASIGTK